MLQSKQLDESLKAIRRAQEEAEYARISSSTTHSSTSYSIPSTYTNISGVDPTLSLTQRFSPHPTLSRKEEEEAWKDTQRILSVILNIFLSTLATATAAWWASGNANAGHKVLVSMLVAVVTAIAEVVLYNRYTVYVRESKKIKKTRMTGSDVRKGENGEFRPLQLDKTTPRSLNGDVKSKAQKGPS